MIGIRGEKSDKADNTGEFYVSARRGANVNEFIDYNKKSANAVDYEDIDELAEEEARPISNAKFQVSIAITLLNHA